MVIFKSNDDLVVKIDKLKTIQHFFIIIKMKF